MRGWAVSGLQRQGKLGNDKEGKPEGSTLTPHVSPYVTPKSLSLLGDREVDRRKEFCATACFGRKNGVTSSSHNLGVQAGCSHSLHTCLFPPGHFHSS